MNMKSIYRILIAILAVAIPTAIAALPTKTGGGGHQQPYDPETGEYIKVVSGS